MFFRDYSHVILNTGIWDAEWMFSYLLVKCRQEKKLPLMPVLQVWGVIFSFTFQVQLCGRLVIHADVTGKAFLSPSLPPLPLTPSLHVFAALIPRQVSQQACSVGSPHLIVCYFFNTYIMYFIRICCQSLSVSIHPISVCLSVCGVGVVLYSR